MMAPKHRPTLVSHDAFGDLADSASEVSRAARSLPRSTAKTMPTSIATHGDQQIVCAIAESRGVSPTTGLAFINLSTTEAVLCQVSDDQLYVRTLHKLQVFEPSVILLQNTAVRPVKSKLAQALENTPEFGACSSVIGRKYWDETAGTLFVERLALKDDVEAIKIALEGKYFAICSFAAALNYIELSLSISFSANSMRMKYEPSECTMMIDASTVQSLELIQSLHNPRSKNCLFGLLDRTLTPMGSRLLRSNILQPLTDRKSLEDRYGAIYELIEENAMFLALRQALKAFLDVDRLLTELAVLPQKPALQHWEQSINNVILVKQYVRSLPAISEALAPARCPLLSGLRQAIPMLAVERISILIDRSINEDVTYQKKPIDSRNQRTYAVKAGVDGLLDLARQTCKEATEDVEVMVRGLSELHKLSLNLKFDSGRQYYVSFPAAELEHETVPEAFVNIFRKKAYVECQTLDMVKMNKRIGDSHNEVLKLSDGVVQQLIEDIRADMSPLFKSSQLIGILDMVTSFADIAMTQDYCRPSFSRDLVVRNGRHPIREKIDSERFVANDTNASPENRFHIVTGCNMSGKSTYIRTVALLVVMAQIGSFVPATQASFPIRRQLFARISQDDNATASVSTFATEMRETAFILRNVEPESLVIVDELGRGTSTRDGLTIAIAVAEALVQSHAFIWFVTHFHELARFLAEKPGVVNQHLVAEFRGADCMRMLYKISSGPIAIRHYGLAFARVAGLPGDIVQAAEEVSAKIARKEEEKRVPSRAILQARKRKLVLELRERLFQTRESGISGNKLVIWLKDLQEDFVNKMCSLDDEEDEDRFSEISDIPTDLGSRVIVKTESMSEMDDQKKAELDTNHQKEPITDVIDLLDDEIDGGEGSSLSSDYDA